MKPRSIVKFRLYVAEDTQNSAKAIANLTDFCQLYLEGRHKIEVVDVFKQPVRALADRVFLTPTLIKLGPSHCRIVGTLSLVAPLLQAAGLKAVAA